MYIFYFKEHRYLMPLIAYLFLFYFFYFQVGNFLHWYDKNEHSRDTQFAYLNEHRSNYTINCSVL